MRSVGARTVGMGTAIRSGTAGRRMAGRGMATIGSINAVGGDRERTAELRGVLAVLRFAAPEPDVPQAALHRDEHRARVRGDRAVSTGGADRGADRGVRVRVGRALRV